VEEPNFFGMLLTPPHAQSAVHHRDLAYNRFASTLPIAASLRRAMMPVQTAFLDSCVGSTGLKLLGNTYGRSVDIMRKIVLARTLKEIKGRIVRWKLGKEVFR
jgi:hypothetical protein